MCCSCFVKNYRAGSMPKILVLINQWLTGFRVELTSGNNGKMAAKRQQITGEERGG